jgi:uncharacterized protein
MVPPVLLIGNRKRCSRDYFRDGRQKHPCGHADLAIANRHGLPADSQLADHRNVQGRFDRVVSIRGFEHAVGRNEGSFMKKVCDSPGSPAAVHVVFGIGVHRSGGLRDNAVSASSNREFSERFKEYAMANEGYHESIEELSDETRDMHRAIVSLMEELEAVDWYNQRVDACKDSELRAILAHNRDEEKEHAAMVLEWIRRKDATMDKELRDYLFTDKPIAHE